MATTDSISVFAEGTFEEQVLELANYISLTFEEPQREAYVQSIQERLNTGEGQTPLAEDEGRRRQVFEVVIGDVKGIPEGSSAKETEGFFNLLYAHLLTLFTADSPETQANVPRLVEIISSSPSVSSSTKYRTLTNLFNALPRRSPLRLKVYTTLLTLASSADELNILLLAPSDVEKWLSEWEISSEEKIAFLKQLVDAYEKAGDPKTSYTYHLSYLRLLPSASPEALSASVKLITAALSDPTIYDFDPLFRIDAVVESAKDHEIFELLRVFLTGGLEELKAWGEKYGNDGGWEKYGLDQAQLEHKMRLLSLASLGFENVGQDLPYAKIAASIDVEESEVEKWVIDVIRTGLLSGKLSQTTQTLHVIRSTSRTFDAPQWELLASRLTAWKAGLEGVLEVVESARKQKESLAAKAAEKKEKDAAKEKERKESVEKKAVVAVDEEEEGPVLEVGAEVAVGA